MSVNVLIDSLFVTFENIDNGCKSGGGFRRYCDACATRIKNEIIELSGKIKSIYPFHSSELFRLKDGLFEAEKYPSYSGVNTFDAHIIVSAEIRILIRHLKSEIDSGNNLGFWQYAHPRVIELCKSKFDDGYYSDAVESAIKEVEAKVKSMRPMNDEREINGSDLMMKSFNEDSPLIELSDRTTQTGRNIQRGYKYIYAGAMSAIRNPNAHGNLSIEKADAVRELILVSLLMFKLDACRILSDENK